MNFVADRLNVPNISGTSRDSADVGAGDEKE